jgi:hypothetical protein
MNSLLVSTSSWYTTQRGNTCSSGAGQDITVMHGAVSDGECLLHVSTFATTRVALPTGVMQFRSNSGRAQHVIDRCSLQCTLQWDMTNAVYSWCNGENSRQAPRALPQGASSATPQTSNLVPCTSHATWRCCVCSSAALLLLQGQDAHTTLPGYMRSTKGTKLELWKAQQLPRNKVQQADTCIQKGHQQCAD